MGRGSPKIEIDDDTIIALAGIGAGLTAYGVAKGAAEVVDTLTDVVKDAQDMATISPKNPVLRALGLGRKGGFL